MQNLEARRRITTGKGSGRRIRASGLVPAVLYGRKGEPVNLAVDPTAVKAILQSPKGQNSVVTVTVAGGETVESAHIVDFQKHPVKRTIVHCDIQRVDPNVLREYTVPIRIEGRSVAERTGGRIVFVTRKTKVRCKPSDCPEAIVVDTTPIEIGQSIRIADMTPPAGNEFVYSDNYPVVTGAGALVEVDEKPAAAEAATAAAEE